MKIHPLPLIQQRVLCVLVAQQKDISGRDMLARLVGSPPQSTVYYALRALEWRGLAESRVAADARPQQRLYRATGAGRMVAEEIRRGDG